MSSSDDDAAVTASSSAKRARHTLDGVWSEVFAISNSLSLGTSLLMFFCLETYIDHFFTTGNLHMFNYIYQSLDSKLGGDLPGVQVGKPIPTFATFIQARLVVYMTIVHVKLNLTHSTFKCFEGCSHIGGKRTWNAFLEVYPKGQGAPQFC